MSGTKRKLFEMEFKAKVSPDAMHGIKIINRMAQERGMHPVQVSQWKKEI